MINVLETYEEVFVYGGVHPLTMLNNCVSNGMNFAGLAYAICAHRHDQRQQQALLFGNQQIVAFDGSKIAISGFVTGCVVSLIDDLFSGK